MERPASDEYIPDAQRYVSLVPEGPLNELMERNLAEVMAFFSAVPPEKQEYCYAPGKWTIKEIVQHLTDGERVFAYRALTIGRGHTDAIFPSMSQNQFAENVNPSHRTLQDILEEFYVVRRSSQFLFRNFSEQQLKTKGKLFDYPVTPRGFAFAIIGHPMHHMQVVKERYLP